MDIVLEVSDRFLFDYMYAWLHPSKLHDFPELAAANVSARQFSTWEYKPATAFFSVEPSEAAYMSEWARDNIYRQSLSLFLIMWYVPVLGRPSRTCVAGSCR
jgi:lathosterol oxidase